MSKFGYNAVTHTDARRNGRKVQGVGVLKFDGEYKTRAQIAEAVGKSVKSVQATVRNLRAQGVRELTREHFA